MSNDFWIGVREQLKEELGREPTDEETMEAYKEKLAELIDYCKDMEKNPHETKQDPAT